jgi:hypothetical protein
LVLTNLDALLAFDKLEQIEHGTADILIHIVEHAPQVGEDLLHEDVRLMVVEDGAHALHP